jgi:hypothetical protein
VVRERDELERILGAPKDRFEDLEPCVAPRIGLERGGDERGGARQIPALETIARRRRA